MKSQALIRRYSEGLAGALKNEAEYEAVRRDIADFCRLLQSHGQLREVLFRPILKTSKKTQIVEDILAKKSYQEKTVRLFLLLLQHRHLDILPLIIEDLPVRWREKQGILTFEVRSVVPLKDSQKRKLQTQIEQLEKSAVHLTYQIDPAIVGGLYIKKGNVAYDVSLKGQLTRLKEKISER
jgi:F-type H+-transporting ATPase subunit delta